MSFPNGLELLTYCMNSISRNNDKKKFVQDLYDKGLNEYFAMQTYRIIKKSKEKSAKKIIKKIYCRKMYKSFFDNLAGIANRYP